jgi:hypothetical protein
MPRAWQQRPTAKHCQAGCNARRVDREIDRRRVSTRDERLVDLIAERVAQGEAHHTKYLSST